MAGEDAVNPKHRDEGGLVPSSHRLRTDGWTDRLLQVNLFPEKPMESPERLLEVDLYPEKPMESPSVEHSRRRKTTVPEGKEVERERKESFTLLNRAKASDHSNQGTESSLEQSQGEPGSGAAVR